MNMIHRELLVTAFFSGKKTKNRIKKYNSEPSKNYFGKISIVSAKGSVVIIFSLFMIFIGENPYHIFLTKRG